MVQSPGWHIKEAGSKSVSGESVLLLEDKTVYSTIRASNIFCLNTKRLEYTEHLRCGPIGISWHRRQTQCKGVAISHITHKAARPTQETASVCLCSVSERRINSFEMLWTVIMPPGQKENLALLLVDVTVPLQLSLVI